MDYLRSNLALYFYNPGSALWRAVEHQLLECTIETLGALPPPVLDIGCGDGKFFELLCGDTWTIDIGIDPAVGAVRDARKVGCYRLAFCNDGRALALRDGSVGTILSNSVLEHIPSAERVVTEGFRVLRPGGLLIATIVSDRYGPLLLWTRVFHAVGLAPLATRYVNWKNRRYGHASIFSASRWKACLEDTGFEVLTLRNYLCAPAVGVCDVLHEMALLGFGRLRLRSLIHRIPYAGRCMPWLMGWILRPAFDACLAADGSDGACVLVVARKPSNGANPGNAA
jgi:SAM-dependent methyltransferase